MKFNSLKEKCEYYRSMADYRVLPNCPIIIMLDGHCFSKKIKKRFDRPFDADFVKLMNDTTVYLLKNIQGARLGYTQSDEISIVINDHLTPETGTLWNGRVCKIQSICAAMASTYFTMEFRKLQESKGVVPDDSLFEFDCKVWSVPNDNDAYAWFLYRQNDCIRNSINQTADAYMSHNKMKKKNTEELKQILKDEYEVNWDNFHYKYRHGRFFIKMNVLKEVQPENSNETVWVNRSVWTEIPSVYGNLTLKEPKMREKFLEIISPKD